MKHFLGSILAICCFLLLLVVVREHIPGQRNQRTSYQVRTGMPKQQALKIMGPPARRIRSATTDSAYVYNASPAASDNIYVGIGADGTVSGVSHAE